MEAIKRLVHLSLVLIILAIMNPHFPITFADDSKSSSFADEISASKPLVWVPWTGKGPQPLPIPNPIPNPIPRPYPVRQGGRGGGRGRGRSRGGVPSGSGGECTCNCNCDCRNTQCSTVGGGGGVGGVGGAGGAGAGAGAGWGGGREGRRPSSPGGWGGGGAAICLPLPVNCQGNNKCYFGNGMSFDIGNMPHFGNEKNEEFTSIDMNVTDPRHN